MKKIILETKEQEIQDEYVIPCDTYEIYVDGEVCALPDYEIVEQEECKDFSSDDFDEF